MGTIFDSGREALLSSLDFVENRVILFSTSALLTPAPRSAWSWYWRSSEEAIALA
jgi:hypothetical protein